MTSVSCVSRAGWLGRKVQRLEVVEVGFDLGADADRVAQGREDAHDLVQGARDGVLGAELRRVPGSVMSMAAPVA